MNISQYFKRKDISTVVDPADITTYRDPKDRRRTLAHDKRSYQADGTRYVHPIAISAEGYSVDIICPYCGKIHRHGNAPGHRVSHCGTYDNPGYIIVIGE